MGQLLKQRCADLVVGFGKTFANMIANADGIKYVSSTMFADGYRIGYCLLQCHLTKAACPNQHKTYCSVHSVEFAACSSPTSQHDLSISFQSFHIITYHHHLGRSQLGSSQIEATQHRESLRGLDQQPSQQKNLYEPWRCHFVGYIVIGYTALAPKKCRRQCPFLVPLLSWVP